MKKPTLQKNYSWKEQIPGVLSWLIPGFIFTLSMALIGAAPFGDDTILLRDSVGQYLDFISYFKSVLRGENDLLYTFSKALGGDFISLASYYLLSPFNLLFLLSTSENIPLFYTAVVILKLSACGASFYWSLQKRSGVKYTHLLFSTAYALMAYNVLYQWNLMWLDGVMILPLVGLGVESIWEKKSSLLYILSLGYALVTNFYIGYMLCIASVLFCLARFLIFEGTFLDRCKVMGRYLFASIIGGLSGAWVWLPAFLSIRQGRSQFDSSIFSFSLNFKPWQLAGKLVAGSGGPEQLASGLPHIFCGTTVLVLAILFFFSKKVSAKTRIAAFIPILAVAGSFFFRFTDVAWHGFSPNISFNYRYAFILSYLLIMLAQHVLTNKLTDSIPGRIAAGVSLACVYIYLLYRQYDYVHLLGILLGISILVLTIWTGSLLKKSALVRALICIIGILELGTNCYLLLDGVVGEVWTLKMSQWSDETPQVSQAVTYVLEQDPGFYRMEKTFQRSHNDAMFFAYNGLSYFGSAERAFVPGFMEKMGFRNHYGIWTYYNTGSTAAVDSFLGVKYLLSRSDLAATKGYALLTQVGDIGVYQNPYVLPIAMTVHPQIGELPMDERDYFALHNQIFSGLCGEDLQIMQPGQNVTVTPLNLRSHEDSEGNLVYEVIDASQQASLRFEIPVTQQLPLYCYFTAPDVQNVTLHINGEDCGGYFDIYRWDMTYAGTYPQGQNIVIELIPEENCFTLEESYFYYEDLPTLSVATDSILKDGVTIEKQASSHLTGQVNSEHEGYLLFTIPYDPGWKLWIDGAKVDTEPVMGTFLAAPVSSGTHSYTLRYIPQGFTSGCVLTFLAVIAIVLDTIHRKKFASPIKNTENEQ